MVNDDFYLSGMAALIDGIDSKKLQCKLARWDVRVCALPRTVNGHAT